MSSAPSFLVVAGRRLETVIVPPRPPVRLTCVFLHEGIGSVSLWRDFPARLHAATGCGLLVYSRYGYGASDVLEVPRNIDYMHHEALEVLPALLDRARIERPVLVGHSDGASIALIHASMHADAVSGVIAEAPHVFVEDESIAGIEAAREAFAKTDLRDRLARHHRDAEKTFRGWNDIWLDPRFRTWNIEAYLPSICVPILAIQGTDDEYGTMAQIDAIARQVAGPCELVKLERCGHSPHRDQPEATLAAMRRFVMALEAAA